MGRYLLFHICVATVRLKEMDLSSTNIVAFSRCGPVSQLYELSWKKKNVLIATLQFDTFPVIIIRTICTH